MDTQPTPQGSAVAIENAHLRAEWRSDTGTFTLTHKPTGRAFVRSGKLRGNGGPARAVDLKSDRLGAGRAIEISLPDGSTDRLVLHPDIPFAFLEADLPNRGSGDQVLRNLGLATVQLDLQKAPSQLRALGTAGLTTPDKQPGSYVYLAVADPESRSGVVAAWVTHDRGSGIVIPSVEGDAMRLDAQIDYGRLVVEPGGTAGTEVFAIGWFDDARIGLERWADLVARWYGIRLRNRGGGYCTWYSSPHGGASDEEHLAQLAEFAARELKPFGLDFIQIDDRWQDGERRNGPAKVFCRHDPDGPYPNGMQRPAAHLRSLGLTPGLWFIPFAGDHEDPFFADKQHLFAKQADGSPYVAQWGGTCLDLTHPDTREYLADVVRRMVHEWGYGYLKMDGLWTGTAAELLYVNNAYRPDDLGEAAFHRPEVTPIEAYRSGLELIREVAGDDTFFLGCCVSQNMRSFGGSFGLVDAMRVGPDNGPALDALRRGPWHGSNRYFLHGRIWYNDPDPVYVRESMPLEHAQLICSWVAVTGQHMVASDWLPGLPEERLDILKRALPPHHSLPRPADLFDADLPRIWLLTDERDGARRDVVGLFNWDDAQPARLECPVDRLGLPPAEAYVGFDYWANQFVPPFSGTLRAELPAGTCRVLALRAVTDHPQVVSTSRHITQGVIDLAAERWDPADGVLSGVSRVVAGDPYELRIAVPTGAASWAAQGVDLAEAPAGTTASVAQEGPNIRVAISPGGGGEVDWRVRFARARVDGP